MWIVVVMFRNDANVTTAESSLPLWARGTGAKEKCVRKRVGKTFGKTVGKTPNLPARE